MNQHSLPNVSKAGNPPLRGPAFALRMRYSLPAARAVAAVDLIGGAIGGLTRAQAAGVAGISRYNVAIAALATADERRGLRLGLITLANVRRAHAHSRRTQPIINSVDDLIAHVSADLIEAAYDKLTAPQVAMAAE